MFEHLITYIRESRQELQKVTWLSRDEVIRYTIAVIVVSLVVAAFLGGIDALLSFLVTRFLL